MSIDHSATDVPAGRPVVFVYVAGLVAAVLVLVSGLLRRRRLPTPPVFGPRLRLKRSRDVGPFAFGIRVEDGTEMTGPESSSMFHRAVGMAESLHDRGWCCFRVCRNRLSGWRRRHRPRSRAFKEQQLAEYDAWAASGLCWHDWTSQREQDQL